MCGRGSMQESVERVTTHCFPYESVYIGRFGITLIINSNLLIFSELNEEITF